MRNPRNTAFGLACYIPPLFVIFLVSIYPIFQAVWIAFHRYDITRPGERGFYGLQNFVQVYESFGFAWSVQVTALFTLVALGLVLLFSFAVALVLSQDFKGKNLLQVLLLIPWGIPFVVSGSMWRWMWDANYGLFNAIAQQLGLISGYVAWLNFSTYAVLAVLIAHVWTSFPFAAILLIAGMASVPKELYEAALIDGAKAVARFRNITLVWIRPMLLIVFIYQTLTALKIFDLVYSITRGGPYDSTDVISFHIWRLAFTYGNFGQGSALALMIVVVGYLIAVFYFRAIKWKTALR